MISAPYVTHPNFEQCPEITASSLRQRELKSAATLIVDYSKFGVELLVAEAAGFEHLLAH